MAARKTDALDPGAKVTSQTRNCHGGVTRLPVAKTYKLYIDGKFPRSESGRYFELNVTAGSCSPMSAAAAARTFATQWSRHAVRSRSGRTPALTCAGRFSIAIAEMLEGRSEQFVAELILQGGTRSDAEAEVTESIDRLVYYAGWADKYQQIFSAVNPVSTSHFNFSVLEPTGVVAVIAPEASGLLGLVSNIGPAIAGGNTCVVLASESQPLSAISLAEVLHASDVPRASSTSSPGARASSSSNSLRTWTSMRWSTARATRKRRAAADRRGRQHQARDSAAGHQLVRGRGAEPLLHQRHAGNQDHLAPDRRLSRSHQRMFRLSSPRKTSPGR